MSGGDWQVNTACVLLLGVPGGGSRPSVLPMVAGSAGGSWDVKLC